MTGVACWTGCSSRRQFNRKYVPRPPLGYSLNRDLIALARAVTAGAEPTLPRSRCGRSPALGACLFDAAMATNRIETSLWALVRDLSEDDEALVDRPDKWASTYACSRELICNEACDEHKHTYRQVAATDAEVLSEIAIERRFSISEIIRYCRFEPRFMHLPPEWSKA